MASTTVVTVLEQLIFGDKRVNLVKFACSSYDSSTGISCTAALCRLAELDYVLPWFQGAGAVGNGPVSVWWDSANKALQLLKATNAQVDTSTVINTAGTIYALAIGA
jgi:hypothetical protein